MPFSCHGQYLPIVWANLVFVVSECCTEVVVCVCVLQVVTIHRNTV
jgi:hypothetical protein